MAQAEPVSTSDSIQRLPTRRFPDALTLLLSCLALATILTYVLPAGEYDRRQDPATGRTVVVPGTYHVVASQPVDPFAALSAIPRGISQAASVIALVFLVGAGLTVVDRTGALREGIDWLVAHLHGREALALPMVAIVFAAGGVVEGMSEEIIALVPALLLLTTRLGYPPITAVAISTGAAFVGGAFSPMNPFQVGIAQKLAGVPLISGWGYRLALLIPALAVWIGVTLWHARRERVEPALLATMGPPRIAPRSAAALVLIVIIYSVYVFGVLKLGWEFDQMSALFLILGIGAGLLGGLGLTGTAAALADGFRSMAYAGMLIGFARGIFVVLNDGRVIDTLVHGLLLPVERLPNVLAAAGMVVAQALIHVPVPSTSGQAVLTMPVLVPLSDLLGISRQVTVLAYQLGGGLCELITPTNGALMAVLAASGVSYDKWIKFCAPIYLALMFLAFLAVGLGAAIGLR